MRICMAAEGGLQLRKKEHTLSDTTSPLDAFEDNVDPGQEIRTVVMNA